MSLTGYTLTASPTSVIGSGDFSVHFTAPGGASAQEWIALCEAGSVCPNGQVSSSYKTGGATSGNHMFNIVATPGAYEFRYYTQYDATTQTNLGSTQVAATYGPVFIEPLVTLDVTPSTAKTADSVTVNWVVGGATAADTIGFYTVGDPDSDAIWSYNAGAHQTSPYASLLMPDVTGSYEFRYFWQAETPPFVTRSGSVAVTGGSNSSYSVTTSSTAVDTGASLTASWQVHSHSSSDTIGLFPVGAPLYAAPLATQSTNNQSSGTT